MKRLLILTAVAILTSTTAGCGGGLFSWLYRGDACGTTALGSCDGCPSDPTMYSGMYGGELLPPAQMLPGPMGEVLQ